MFKAIRFISGVLLYGLLVLCCACFINSMLLEDANALAKKTFYVDINNGQSGASCEVNDPCLSAEEGVNALKSYVYSTNKSADLVIKAGVYDRLKVKDLHCPKNDPCMIRGEGFHHTLFHSWGWDVINIANSSYVVLANIRAEGGGMNTVTIGGTVETHHIMFYLVKATRGGSRAMFINDTNNHHLYFFYSEFGDLLNHGGATHAVYITGAHWKKDAIPYHHIYFFGCEFWGAWRWGLQVNGRLQQMIVANSVSHHNELGMSQLIGGRHVTFVNNVSYQNAKQSIVLYNYCDYNYWDCSTAAGFKEWWDTHWPSGHVTVAFNTLKRPKHNFTNLKPYKPKDHNTILFSKSSNLNTGFREVPDFKNNWIIGNISADWEGKFIGSTGTDLNAAGNIYMNNLAYNYGGQNVWVNNDGYVNTLQYFDANYDNWKNNKVGNPFFKKFTEIFVDASVNMESINWEQHIVNYHEDLGNDFHLESNSAAAFGGYNRYFLAPFDYDLVPRSPYSNIGAYEFRPNKSRGSSGNKGTSPANPLELMSAFDDWQDNIEHFQGEVKNK